MTNPVLSAAGRLQSARRSGADPDVVRAHQQELATARVEAFARKIVDQWPPLTDDQVERVARILRGDAA